METVPRHGRKDRRQRIVEDHPVEERPYGEGPASVRRSRPYFELLLPDDERPPVDSLNFIPARVVGDGVEAEIPYFELSKKASEILGIKTNNRPPNNGESFKVRMVTHKDGSKYFHYEAVLYDRNKQERSPSNHCSIGPALFLALVRENVQSKTFSIMSPPANIEYTDESLHFRDPIDRKLVSLIDTSREINAASILNIFGTEGRLFVPRTIPHAKEYVNKAFGEIYIIERYEPYPAETNGGYIKFIVKMPATFSTTEDPRDNSFYELCVTFRVNVMMPTFEYVTGSEVEISPMPYVPTTTQGRLVKDGWAIRSSLVLNARKNDEKFIAYSYGRGIPNKDIVRHGHAPFVPLQDEMNFELRSQPNNNTRTNLTKIVSSLLKESPSPATSEERVNQYVNANTIKTLKTLGDVAPSGATVGLDVEDVDGFPNELLKIMYGIIADTMKSVSSEKRGKIVGTYNMIVSNNYSSITVSSVHVSGPPYRQFNVELTRRASPDELGDALDDALEETDEPEDESEVVETKVDPKSESKTETKVETKTESKTEDKPTVDEAAGAGADS